MAERPTRSRIRAERRGRRAEHIAALFLTCKGYRIIALRHKAGVGEVDIIARKGDLAIFVEVKARHAAEAAIDAVTPQAMQRIRAAADHWLARQKDWQRISLRFDIIAIVPRRWPKHFPDAF